jgi:dephospho-CoA kinase
MIRIALVGDIGSGKTFISRLFGFPVFNADQTVSEIYKKDKKIFNKLKKNLPSFFSSFPIKKKELIKAIIKNEKNIKIISSIIHPVVRKNLNLFLKKNKRKKIVILDIPLFFEKKLNLKKDKVVFIFSRSKDIKKRLVLRQNFNNTVHKQLKKLQLSLNYKKKRSNYIIKNNFNLISARKSVKNILNKINI